MIFQVTKEREGTSKWEEQGAREGTQAARGRRRGWFRWDGELQSSGDAGEGDALEASSGGGGIADNALGRVGSGMNGL